MDDDEPMTREARRWLHIGAAVVCVLASGSAVLFASALDARVEAIVPLVMGTGMLGVAGASAFAGVVVLRGRTLFREDSPGLFWTMIGVYVVLAALFAGGGVALWLR
jgi:hypothetical protein